jgi:hypothetical protein
MSVRPSIFLAAFATVLALSVAASAEPVAPPATNGLIAAHHIAGVFLGAGMPASVAAVPLRRFATPQDPTDAAAFFERTLGAP